MLGEDAESLHATLSRHAKDNLGWIMDQAHCLSHHLRPDGQRRSVIGEFSIGVAEEAAKTSRRLGILSFATAAACLKAGDPRQKYAIKRHVDLLRDIARTDLNRALDIAAMTVSGVITANPMRVVMLDFILTHAGKDDARFNYLLARTASMLDEGSIDMFMRRLARHAYQKPYETMMAIREMMDNADKMTFTQREKATALQNALGENPVTLNEVLKREYDIDLGLPVLSSAPAMKGQRLH